MSKSLERILKAVWLADCENSATSETIMRADAFLRKHAHMVPENDGSTPNPWRKNMDYSGWEQSPYYGSVSEFMEKFPGGIGEWLAWRKKSEKDRWTMFSKPVEEHKKVAALSEPFHDMEEEEEYKPTEEELSESEREPTKEERKKSEGLLGRMVELGLISEEDVRSYMREKAHELQVGEFAPKLAHFVPEGKDDVSHFGKNEYPLYSGEGMSRFKSIRDFLKQYKRRGQSADDAALMAIHDTIAYWKELLKGKERRQKNKKRSGK